MELFEQCIKRISATKKREAEINLRGRRHYLPKMSEHVGRYGVRKGAWSEQEDVLLKQCVEKYGEGKWHQVPINSGVYIVGLMCITVCCDVS